VPAKFLLVKIRSTNKTLAEALQLGKRLSLTFNNLSNRGLMVYYDQMKGAFKNSVNV